MTNRRRNIFILLFVAGLLAASSIVAATQPTRLGLDLQGGIELVYQAKPTPQQPKITTTSLDRAIDVIRERVDQLGVAEPEIQRSGNDQLSVSLPDIANPAKAERQVGKVAQLYFYDWEPNVIGPDGKPDPKNPQVTGGPAAGTSSGAISLYQAVLRAAKRPAENTGGNSHNGLYYLVNEKTKEVLSGPEEQKPDLFKDGTVPTSLTSGQKVYEVKPGTTIIRADQPDTQKGPPRDLWFVLRDNVALRGTEIRNPEQQFNQGAGGNGSPNVTFELSKKGQRIWQQTTRKIAERGLESQIPGQDVLQAAQHFAIVLDNEIISAPYINFRENPDGIDARSGSEIQGGFTIDSAQELANLLKTGALPVKLELISQSQVSATLGKQSLDQGLKAGIVGFIVVALFLLIMYRLLGLIAVAALGIYAVYFYALIKLIPITMTLPGIAGLILTIGVAADANIVIFERVKEEIRRGRSVPAGIAAGYKRGLTAIIDANIVTVMVAFILFVLATAGVKGFAFTLGIGTIVSFLTAVLATQAVLGTMGSTRLASNPAALGAGDHKQRWKLDFVGASKWFFSMSGVILLVGALALAGKGVNLGIDFESGTRIKTALTKPADENAVREVMAKKGFADAKIQRVQEPKLGKYVFQIATSSLKPNEVQGVRQALDQQFGASKNFSNSSIGPTFGQTVAKGAIIAIIASLLVISLYIGIRFEWKYAVPVLIALLHDLLITAGVYSIAGREVTTATVAALLTILGFSLYDTIIVFDRIRENVPRMPRAAFSQIVNRSMSEVLTRSLATSFCTVLPVVALMLFGGDTLGDFAFALIVGTASGTYSSVFIASPVLTHWKEREQIYRRRRAAIALENNGVVPAFVVAKTDEAEESELEEPKQRQTRRRLTAPDDPQQSVSAEEFAEMVRGIQHETASSSQLLTSRDAGADLTPDEVVMPKQSDKQKKNKTRNRKRRS